MRKKLFFQGVLLTMLISGCMATEKTLPTVSNRSITIQDGEETIISDICENPEAEKEDDVEKLDQRLINQDIIKYNLTIRDILIPEDAYLKSVPFMVGSMEGVLTYNPNLKKTKSEEGANGYFNYWTGSGIEYITYGEDWGIYGLIISSDYSLNCGLKIGMKESELQKYFPVMEKYEKRNLKKEGQIIFAGNMMRDKLGPLKTTDYDCVYACVCAASEKEVEEYKIYGTIAYSVTAFVKDGKVCKIVLDLPTAG